MPCCAPSASEAWDDGSYTKDLAVTAFGIIQLVLYLAVIIAITKPLGLYMAKLFGGERVFLSLVLRPVERGIYRLTGVDEGREMRWTTYAVAMLLFNLAGVLVLHLFQRAQAGLPFNSEELPNVEARSAFNTAVSFVTNTNWQGYVGEATMSYFTQMAGLTVQNFNFVSVATGIAIAIALVRGFARRSAGQIGNFWVDLVRATLYLLLPISIVGCLILVALGVPQNLGAYVDATGLSGAAQTIAMGPVASQ
jgi:potassium-transporting ATPase potassium-binding subunit